MIQLVYDGTFDGLVCAFREALGSRDQVAEFVADSDPDAGAALFGTHRIATDVRAANMLLDDLRAAAGPRCVRNLVHAYMADDPSLPAVMFRYLRETLEQKCCIDGWHSNESVRDLLRWVRKVTGEIHRFRGLLRFRELADGTFYAPFEPDHNIVLQVARHFTRRLPDQRWVIHDRRRSLAALWDTGHLHPTDVPKAALSPGPTGALELADEERLYQTCWRTYTEHIAVEGRDNPKLQRAFMPRRYWRYLVETPGAG